MFVPAWEFPQRTGVLAAAMASCCLRTRSCAAVNSCGWGKARQLDRERTSRDRQNFILIYVCAVNPCGIYCPHV